MDPGLAALLGASVGGAATLLAGFFGPWIRESVQRKADRKARNSDALAIALVDMIQCLANVLRSKQTSDGNFLPLHTKAAVSISRVAVLLDKKDSGVESIASMALNAITQSSVEIATISLTTSQGLWHEWIRGQVPGPELERLYVERGTEHALDKDV